MTKNIYKQLLPTGRAFNIIVEKNLRKLFITLEEKNEDFINFFDLVWLDIFPQTTRQLSAWERQFGLVESGLSTLQRRERLAGAWVALGGQTPSYIEDTLQTAGFPLVVTDWWFTKSPLVIKVPSYYLRSTATTVWNAQCGEPNAECGQSWMQCGESYTIPGYLVLNGEETLLPALSADDARYFFYVSGDPFPSIAQVPIERKNELEMLIQKIAPSQAYIGLLVEYV